MKTTTRHAHGHGRSEATWIREVREQAAVLDKKRDDLIFRVWTRMREAVRKGEDPTPYRQMLEEIR